jgi:phosphatidate cytidylyltransferase
MLRWRLLLGTLLIAALFGLCWLDYRAVTPGVWLVPLAAVVSVLAAHEVLELAAAANLHPVRWTVYLGNLLLLAGSWLSMGQRHLLFMDAERWSVLALAVLLVLIGAMCRYREPGGNWASLAAGVFAVVYVGLMLSFAVRLRMEWGMVALASWVAVVKMGDTGAYTVGRLIGRHKMAPRISPGKTIEGGLGALAFSCLASWLVFQCPASCIRPRMSGAAGPWWGWIAFGLLLGTAGMLGDLAESLLKRDVGRKDSSAWMPGFGGALDILDSLLLSAPVAWACWAFGLVGPS